MKLSLNLWFAILASLVALATSQRGELVASVGGSRPIADGGGSMGEQPPQMEEIVENDEERLSPEQLRERLNTGFFDAVVDVRPEEDFKEGHIRQATLVAGLADDASLTSALEGCEYCNIVVYCNNGAAAAAAIDNLKAAGFKGRLMNGQGVEQWTEAGFQLVKTQSVVPKCTTEEATQDMCFEKWELNDVLGPDRLDAYEMRDYLEEGFFDVIVDVRPTEDFNEGHIEGATHVGGLADDPFLSASLMGCEYCNIVVYCNNGMAAAAAIENLKSEGFKGVLMNGQGVQQWTDAGFSLTTEASVVPMCTTDTATQEMCLRKWEDENGEVVPEEAERLNPFELRSRLDDGFFDAVVDVRPAPDFMGGHIRQATHIGGLADDPFLAANLKGCEYCDIVVYCNNGAAAAAAIGNLESAGFRGRLLNGQGVEQWVEAGFPLTRDASVIPACTYDRVVQNECFLKWLTYQETVTLGRPTGDVGVIDGTSPVLSPVISPSSTMPTPQPPTMPTVPTAPMPSRAPAPTRPTRAPTRPTRPTRAPSPTRPTKAPTKAPSVVIIDLDPTASPVEGGPTPAPASIPTFNRPTRAPVGQGSAASRVEMTLGAIVGAAFMLSYTW